jgi:mycothiol system anti-sigma-R factor
MKGCGDYGTNIPLYLDRELRGRDLEEFRGHLEGCELCRLELKADEELSSLLHRSRPLYSAPDALRDRVLQITAKPLPSPSYAPPRLRKRVLKILARPL